MNKGYESKQKLEPTIPKCTVCNSTLDDILKVGRLGCPMCYEVFSFALSRFIPQLNLKHVGKKPKSNLIKVLEEQMTDAALNGRFDEASVFQDQIKEIKGNNEQTH